MISIQSKLSRYIIIFIIFCFAITGAKAQDAGAIVDDPKDLNNYLIIYPDKLDKLIRKKNEITNQIDNLAQNMHGPGSASGQKCLQTDNSFDIKNFSLASDINLLENTPKIDNPPINIKYSDIDYSIFFSKDEILDINRILGVK